MDGKLLLRELKDLLNEADDSGWFSDFSGYNYLYQAAIEFVSRTKCLRTTQAITTVADQSAYPLNVNFLQLYLRDPSQRNFIKLNDGSSDYFVFYRDYGTIYFSNNTTSIQNPDYFTISDYPALSSRITGTATANGAASGGECTLTDTAGNFTNANVGDVVHNTTDGSHGIILSKTSATAIVTALFEGTDNDWDSGDAYVIQPQGRNQVILDPPPSVSGYTITVPYVERPAPVYSDYGIYRFPAEYSTALVKYAYWLYKYRDSEPKFGDAMYQYFERQVRGFGYGVTDRLRRTSSIRVNLRARNGR